MCNLRMLKILHIFLKYTRLCGIILGNIIKVIRSPRFLILILSILIVFPDVITPALCDPETTNVDHNDNANNGKKSNFLTYIGGVVVLVTFSVVFLYFFVSDDPSNTAIQLYSPPVEGPPRLRRPSQQMMEWLNRRGDN